MPSLHSALAETLTTHPSSYWSLNTHLSDIQFPEQDTGIKRAQGHMQLIISRTGGPVSDFISLARLWGQEPLVTVTVLCRHFCSEMGKLNQLGFLRNLGIV